MKTSFKLSNLWHSKEKPVSHKTKTNHSSRHKRNAEQDEWAMSPEDALRVSYSGNK